MMSNGSTTASTSPLLGHNPSQRGQKQLSDRAYPGWYTPGRLLGLFCWVSFLVYLDRGLLASNGVNEGYTVRAYL